MRSANAASVATLSASGVIECDTKHHVVGIRERRLDALHVGRRHRTDAGASGKEEVGDGELAVEVSLGDGPALLVRE